MSAALQHSIGPYTIEDWLALDPPVDGSRIELIFGYLHVTPAPSGRHQYAAYRVTRLIEDTLDAAGRTDLYVVPAVNVKISTVWRITLIPDVVVLRQEPDDVSFAPESVVLAVEVWSPGNSRADRETKMAGFAGSGVPFVWTIEQGDRQTGLSLTAYRLENEQYIPENIVPAGGSATITAAPVPVYIDLTTLMRRQGALPADDSPNHA